MRTIKVGGMILGTYIIEWLQEGKKQRSDERKVQAMVALCW